MLRDPQSRAYALALIAVFLWSTVASAFKLSLRVLTPVQLLLIASLVAGVTLLTLLALQGKLGLLRAGAPRAWFRSLLLGLLNPFLYYVFVFESYARLPGQEAQPLNFTWAIALAVLSVPLLGQRIRPLGFVAILISFVGVYVISTRGDLGSFTVTDPLGVGLALSSSVIWALFWIYNLRDPRDEVAKLCLSFLCGFVCTLVYALATGQALLPAGGDLDAGFAGGIYVGLFEMGLTFVLWLKALKLSRTTAQVSNLIFLAPFVSLVLLHFLAGETIYPSSVVGLVLIVAGIILQRRHG